MPTFTTFHESRTAHQVESPGEGNKRRHGVMLKLNDRWQHSSQYYSTPSLFFRTLELTLQWLHFFSATATVHVYDLNMAALSNLGKISRFIWNNGRLFHSASLLARAHNSSEPVAKPEGRQTITMIPGDGVGPELMADVKDVFSAAGG